MNNKNTNGVLNNKLINIIIVILSIVIICIGTIFVIEWIKTNDLIFIISGSIIILGLLFNIYLLYKLKSKNEE
jgi:hypothetical protein